ncbi:MAG: hypothetical protein ACLBM2_05540 [Dolichospermum sp.]
MVKPAVIKNGPSQNISFQSLFLFILYSREQGTGNREQVTGYRGAEEKIFSTDN